MFKKTLVAPIAVAFGLTLTGAGAAQVMLGDQDVSDADLVAVQDHCDALELAASTAPSGEEPTVDINSDPTLGVELSTITLQQCIDAGLIEGPVPGLTPGASDEGSADDSSADEGTDDPNEDATQ